MLVRTLGGLLLLASVVDAAVTAHEMLKTAKEPAAYGLADRLMPLDAANDLRGIGLDGTVSDESLRASLKKDPWDTHSWIELSARAEMRGDRAQAEEALRQAAAHNVGREPRWALSNFYFRQHDTAQTMLWINNYRAVSHDGEESLFRMVAELEPDGAAWPGQMPHMACDELKTAIDVLETREHAGDALVDRMTQTCHDETSNKELSELVSGLLLKDQSVRAGEVWQQMGRSAMLDNADFRLPVTGEGFDWRVNQSPNVEEHQTPTHGVQFSLNDGVTDGTVLLFQPEIFEAGSHYRLSMLAHSDPDTVDAFRWEIVELSTGRHIPSGLDEENINERTSWEFDAPLVSNKTLALALYYRRPEGATSFTGRLFLEGTQLSRKLASSRGQTMARVR